MQPRARKFLSVTANWPWSFRYTSSPASLLGDATLLLVGSSADGACGSDPLGWMESWGFKKLPRWLWRWDGGRRSGKSCPAEPGAARKRRQRRRTHVGGGCQPSLQWENWVAEGRLRREWATEPEPNPDLLLCSASCFCLCLLCGLMLILRCCEMRNERWRAAPQRSVKFSEHTVYLDICSRKHRIGIGATEEKVLC